MSIEIKLHFKFVNRVSCKKKKMWGWGVKRIIEGCKMFLSNLKADSALTLYIYSFCYSFYSKSKNSKLHHHIRNIQIEFRQIYDHNNINKLYYDIINIRAWALIKRNWFHFQYLVSLYNFDCNQTIPIKPRSPIN